KSYPNKLLLQTEPIEYNETPGESCPDESLSQTEPVECNGTPANT
ncbi:13287_t:CDS:1, partial [Racocetra persica]